mmetsp:Transcript_62754/g.148614  ORF Transcript_62754/g.148614 Transcript_62754/m.148614 type:complete len:242 (+) Transcript_62754:68-793(+)
MASLASAHGFVCLFFLGPCSCTMWRNPRNACLCLLRHSTASRKFSSNSRTLSSNSVSEHASWPSSSLDEDVADVELGTLAAMALKRRKRFLELLLKDDARLKVSESRAASTWTLYLARCHRLSAARVSRASVLAGLCVEPAVRKLRRSASRVARLTDDATRCLTALTRAPRCRATMWSADVAAVTCTPSLCSEVRLAPLRPTSRPTLEEATAMVARNSDSSLAATASRASRTSAAPSGPSA